MAKGRLQGTRFTGPQWFPCRLHRSYSKPSRAPTHSHTTRSSVALRKMVLSGLDIHVLAAHTCLRLGSVLAPCSYTRRLTQQSGPHLIALSVLHVNTLRSQAKRNDETTMLCAICAPSGPASGKSLLSHSNTTLPWKPLVATRPHEPRVHKSKSPCQFLQDLPSPQHLTFSNFRLETL